MKKLVLIISSLMMALFSFGQSGSELIELGVTKKYPMHEASIYKLNSSKDAYYVPVVTISSTIDSVFSSCNGKVYDVVGVANIFALTIVDSLGNFYYYSGMKKVYITKGSIISKGSLIGFADNMSSGPFTISLMISDKNLKKISEEKIWQLIKDQ